MEFLKSIKLSGFLSFPPDAEAIRLTPLNVIIGPNGSGKSNLIEAIELLRGTPTAFASAIRDGGGAQEWMWKGHGKTTSQAKIEAEISGNRSIPDLRYRLEFAPSGMRTEVVDEAIEELEKRDSLANDVYFYYRFQKGRPVLNIKDETGDRQRKLQREDLVPDESVLSQRKGKEEYPEITWLGQQFGSIQTFREWSFGRYSAVRQPQPAGLPTDSLTPDSRNLAQLLNELEFSGASPEFNRLMKRFLPRYQKFSVRLQSNLVQLYLHEDGLNTPVSATRLSDGTIRFMAILALLLSPNPPPLLCIEEPELGLHPDSLNLLADVLVSASKWTQLIVTTHSDTLISALTEEADSVLVCNHVGGTTFERVDKDRIDHWLEEYRLGEAWRVGAIGGNP